MRAYAKNTVFAFALWLVLPLVMYFPRFLIEGTLFPALCEWFPSVFENYSPVLDGEAYAIQAAVLDVSIGTLTLLIYSYVLVRYDNERMEFMISKTEGFYTLREGAALYYPRYARRDALISVCVPISFIIASAFVPEHIYDFVDPIFDYIFSFSRLFTDHLGFFIGAVITSLSVFVTRMLAGLKSVRAWQGIWLSEID